MPYSLEQLRSNVIVRCLAVGRRCAKYLLQLASGLFASRALDTVDLRFALSGFQINGEFDFRHVASHFLEFNPDLDSLADSLFEQRTAELSRHLSGRCFVVLVLKPHDKILSESIIEVHVIDHGDVA